MILTILKKSLHLLPMPQFKRFYMESVEPLRRHLRKISGMKGEDLDDILQETYLQALKSWDSLQDPQAALGWLFTIGRRQLFRHYDQTSKQRQRHDETRVEDLEETSADRSLNPESSVGEQNTTRVIADMISMIPDPVRRTAVRRYYLEEWSLREIAAEQGVNPSTITTWLSRFRDNARQQLQYLNDAPRRAVAVPLETLGGKSS